MVQVRQRLGASERHVYRTLGQPRTTQRRVRKVRARKAEDRELLEAGADVEDVGLTEEEKRELLGR